MIIHIQQQFVLSHIVNIDNIIKNTSVTIKLLYILTVKSITINLTLNPIQNANKFLLTINIEI